MSTIVYTPGVWDMFHFGHLDYLRRAKLHGDTLVIGVQSNASVEKQKGQAPIIPHVERATIIQALGIVSHVMIYDELDHCQALAACAADVLVLSNEDESEHGKAAEHWMGTYGRPTVRIGRTPGVSTTDIRQRVIEQGDGDIDEEIEIGKIALGIGAPK